MKNTKEGNVKNTIGNLKTFFKKTFLIISIIVFTLSIVDLILLNYLPIRGNIYYAKVRSTNGVIEYEIKVNKETIEINETRNGIRDAYGDREILGYYLWDNDLFIRYGGSGDAVHAGTKDNFELTYRFPIIVEDEFLGYAGTVELKCKITSTLKTITIVIMSISAIFMAVGFSIIIYDKIIAKYKESKSESKTEGN